MKYYSVFILFLVFSASLSAQKRLFKAYDARDTHTVFVESDDIFQIKFTTAQTDNITIYTQIEGETFESTLLHTEIVEGVLKITTGRTPDFAPFNDKLSAHKVLSIVIEIIVPEGLSIDVYSTLASVKAQGDYDQVRVNLGRGGCHLSSFRFRESVHINTISGNITIETKNAKILAQSRNGNVVISKGITGVRTIELQTMDGDISVIKSQ